jgi:sugar O-acyltransferase (sialic acid O-acetyltransferase NeuD family)
VPTRRHRRQLIIIGTGGYGRELLDVVEAVNAATPDAPAYHLAGFVAEEPRDGSPPPAETARRPIDEDLVARRGARLLGGLDRLADVDADYLIGVASPGARARIDRYASALGRRPATLVHPRATVGGDVTLGPGTVICALASITTNVTTGRHVLLDVAASVAHDCRLRDYATLAPGARVCGDVEIGDRAWIGSQATVVRMRRIGPGAVVGAGAVVVDDVLPDLVVAGVPARPIAAAGSSSPGAPRDAGADATAVAGLPADDRRPPAWPPPRHPVEGAPRAGQVNTARSTP